MYKHDNIINYRIQQKSFQPVQLQLFYKILLYDVSFSSKYAAYISYKRIGQYIKKLQINVSSYNKDTPPLGHQNGLMFHPCLTYFYILYFLDYKYVGCVQKVRAYCLYLARVCRFLDDFFLFSRPHPQMLQDFRRARKNMVIQLSIISTMVKTWSYLFNTPYNYNISMTVDLIMKIAFPTQ